MNCRHIISVQGLLKLAGLITVLLAAGVGTGAFLSSEYNTLCRNSSPLPPIVPTSPSTGSSDSPQTESSSGQPFTGLSTLRWRTTPPPGLVDGRRFLEVNPTTDSEAEKDMAPVLWMEKFHLGACYLALVISLILLIISLVIERLEFSKIFKAISFTYYFLGAIVLIVSAIFIAYATLEIDRQICQVHQFESKEDCQKYIQKMCSAGLAVLTAVFYGVLSYLQVSTKLYEEV